MKIKIMVGFSHYPSTPLGFDMLTELDDPGYEEIQSQEDSMYSRVHSFLVLTSY